jgi:hypothetical protein
MSARKLCSIIQKSTNHTFRRSLFTISHSVNLNARRYSQALGQLTKDQAHDLVFRLNEEERVVLYNTLEQFQVNEDKRKLECK